MNGFIVLIGRTDVRPLEPHDPWPPKIGMALNTGALAEYYRFGVRQADGENAWLYIHTSKMGERDIGALLKDLGWERAPDLEP